MRVHVCNTYWDCVSVRSWQGKMAIQGLVVNDTEVCRFTARVLNSFAACHLMNIAS